MAQETTNTSLRDITAFLRTIIFAVVVGGVGYGGGWLYQNFHPDARIEEMQQRVEAAQAELQVAREQVDRLQTVNRLLKVDRRVAIVTCLNQMANPNTGRALTEIAFQEVNSEGQPIEQARKFTIEGDVVYLDYWLVKFEDRYIESSDSNRSSSICMFRRLFGEFQEPNDGFTLDQANTRPVAYGAEPLSPFEQQIWGDFWSIAHNPAHAEQLGIRAMHGEAVSVKMRKNVRYRVQLRASGGLTVQPINESIPTGPAA